MDRRVFLAVLGLLAAPAATRSQPATKVFPIMTNELDPVGSGLVASLAKPASNVTGLTSRVSDLAANACNSSRC